MFFKSSRLSGRKVRSFNTAGLIMSDDNSHPVKDPTPAQCTALREDYENGVLHNFRKIKDFEGRPQFSCCLAEIHQV
jgi:hypothetical protein